MDFARPRPSVALFFLGIWFLPVPLVSASAFQQPSQTSPAQSAKPAAPKQPAPARPPTEIDELPQAIESAGNDRVALVRNLEDFLKKYPASGQRPQIYRALVEASLQLRDNVRAADYAERIVALMPEDISMTLLAVQLLERSGDEPALRRAVNYATRVLDYVGRSSVDEKSPKISKAEWETRQKNDRTNLLVLRGRLYFRLHDNANAQKDFQASLALTLTAVAAEKLGEIAELNKDLNTALKEYALAFVLSGPSQSQDGTDRREIRRKLGNVWRLAHGSDQGLGDALLHAYDDAIAASESPKPDRNAGATEPYDFKLRNARDGSSYSLADQKGKIVVLSFWATWCGPCREEIPGLIALQKHYSDRLQIIGLVVDDDDEKEIRDVMESKGINYPVAMADSKTRADYGGIAALPTIFIINTEGRVVQKHVGLYNPALFETEVRALLGLPIAAKVETFEDEGDIFLKHADRAKVLPGVDMSNLSLEERDAALHKFNAESCDCGCKFTLAQCRIYDPACKISQQRTAEIVKEVSKQENAEQKKQEKPAEAATPVVPTNSQKP
jgi:thiol-disulfide isomerase/thioredoxin